MTKTSLGDLAAIYPCVMCGYCCMKVPCAYGSVNPDTGWCVHLVLHKETAEYKQYACGHYDEIVKIPGAWINPAFGYGCSSTLFNCQRSKVVHGLKKEKENNEDSI